MQEYVLVESLPTSARVLNSKNEFIGLTPLLLERSRYRNVQVSIVFGTEVKQAILTDNSDKVVVEFIRYGKTASRIQRAPISQRFVFLICSGIFFSILVYHLVRLDTVQPSNNKDTINGSVGSVVVPKKELIFELQASPSVTEKKPTILADNKYENFTLYNIKGFGSIFIPNTMELQQGDYKKMNDGFIGLIDKKFDLDIMENRIVFQQKGLNNIKESGFHDYARVIIEYEDQSYTDYISSFSELTDIEKDAISSEAKHNFQEEMDKLGIKLIEWNGVEVVDLGDIHALRFSYLRQLHNNPVVEVSVFCFWNNNKLNRLTVSYRRQNKNNWSAQMATAINSLTIHGQ
jgi:hypothetical protein